MKNCDRKIFWTWIGNKIKYSLIAFGIVVVAIVAVDEINNKKIPADLQLKVAKEDIVRSVDYTQYEYEKDANGEDVLDKSGNPIIAKANQMVRYSYKSEEPAPQLPDEVIEKRTENIVTKSLGNNQFAAQSGYDFYQENGEWKQIKSATTTKEVFNKATLSPISWLIENVFAANTASTSPGTMADDAATGTIAWADPNNAKVSDNAYAKASSSLTSYTHYLKATNFGFSIPTSATINGISVEIERKRVDVGGPSSFAKDTEVKIVKSNGAIGTTNKADTVTDWPISDTYKSYGSPSDLWGEAWNYSDINDVDFGVVLQAYLPAGSGYADPCLDENSLISTINGYVKIKDIKVGDSVISYNEITKKSEPKIVTSVWSSPISDANNRYFYIYYNNGQVIKATENHRFYVEGNYVEAQNLKIGDKLLSKDLQEQPIEKIEIVENTEDMVWDLTVEDNHNFFVNDMLVHNANWSSDAYVDHFRITIYYTEAAGVETSSPVIFKSGAVFKSGVIFK